MDGRGRGRGGLGRGGFGRGRGGFEHRGRGNRGAGRGQPAAGAGGLGRGAVPQTPGQAIGAERKWKIFPTPLKRLEELLSRDDREVILTLQDVNFGFSELLASSHMAYDVIASVMALLAKSIKCDSCPQSLMALLNDVLCSELLSVHVPRYLTTAPHDRHEVELDRVRDVIEYLVNVSEQLLQRFPNKASEVLGIAFLTARDIIARFETSAKPVRKAVVGKMEMLEKARTDNLLKYASDMRDQLSAAEVAHARLPPSDFRSMDIFPNQTDIHETLHPFLRANLVRGQYNDVDHYLDVHFRLMREDFVAPLRDGLTKYLALVNRGKRDEAQRLKEIRVYFNVRVVTIEVTPNEGLVHLISFDVSKLQKIRWEVTKRLMYGSLACISADNFQTFQLGIVVKRDAKLLSEGYVYINLVGANNARLAPNVVYTLAESPAYFEAYNPILRGLQAMQEDSIPFKQYFIDASTNLGAPRYLRENTMYDFASLTATPSARRACRVLATNEDDGQWPSAAQLQLDAAQYSALKTCLTKEVAVVQGPPGTGKTFLGLKVVEMLIRNPEAWNAGESPILIVCYTNHALDQFLEGILRFSPLGLVRIGGQSRTPIMEPHNLASLRRLITLEHRLPGFVYSNRKQLFEELRTIEYEVGDQMEIVKQSESRVLHEDVLQPFMQHRHYKQILFQHENYFRHLGLRRNMSPAILTWLNLLGINMDGSFETSQKEEKELVVGADEDPANYLLEVDDVLAEEERGRRIEDRYFDDDDYGADYLARRHRRNYENRQTKFADFGPLVDADGFQIQGGKKKLKKTVQWRMKQTTVMTKAEADGVRNVFQLALNDRWRLYRHWVSELRQSRIGKVKKLHDEYERTHLRLKEVLREMDVGILRNAKVIGVTTTGAAKNRELLQIIAPKVVVVEEAAEVLEAHIITALSGQCEHLILIGDQQQLRPNPTVYRLAHEYSLDVSLFERLIGNGLPYERLLLQHRMRPRISKLLVPHIYKDLRDHSSVDAYPHVRGFVHDVYFVNHSHAETTVSDTSSRANGFEAQFLLGTCRHLLLQGYKPEQITILATYLGQAFLIKQLKTNTIAKDVKCTVVDNFQGEENDIVLLSLVRSNEDGKVGFLKIDNRVCVALSRAKIGLICIGNFDFLAENARIWKAIVDSMRIDGLVGPKLQLRCANHPNVITEVVTVKDFDAVPEGGCNLPCEYRLPCGHQCPMMCHVYDEHHKEVKCRKPCEKDLCVRQHKCKKLCSQECGKCFVMVAKVLPQCGHEMPIACHKEPDTVICPMPCEKLLSCGHGCSKTCGEWCRSSECDFKINIDALCGHVVSAPCNLAGKESHVMAFCNHPCSEILPCEHRCTGNCNSCRQGRMHQRCKYKCGRTLICGHTCNVPCARTCPPCQKKCENRCEHSTCPLRCGVPCTPCKEPCAWRCEHQRCNKLCKEPCDRPPCDEACPKQLECGHPCIGFCGEPCPKQCRVCDKEKVCEIFLGNEDEEDARFVLLIDCGHIIESTGMDHFLGQTPDANLAPEGEGHVAIEMKRCPRCKTIIRRTLRYMTAVNQTLTDVMAIKSKYFGESNQLLKMVANLKKLSLEMQHEMIFGGNLNCILKVRSLTAVLGHLSLTDSYNLTNMATLSLAMQREYRLVDPWQPAFSIVVTRFKELDTWFACLDKQSSAKEIQDFTQEFERVRMLSKLVRHVNSIVLNPKAKPYYDRALMLLIDLQPYTEHVAAEVKDLLREMEKNQTGLGISEAEKMEILSAITDLKVGQWFKCPNGHIYAIGECGGAMQIGKCPECGATIGGQHHQLLRDNQLATEMDGATRPAYPTALMR